MVVKYFGNDVAMIKCYCGEHIIVNIFGNICENCQREYKVIKNKKVQYIKPS